MYTQDKEKGITVYHNGKSSVHKRRQQERRKRTKEIQNNQKTMNKMAIVSSCLSIITLNVSGINCPIKRHRMAE